MRPYGIYIKLFSSSHKHMSTNLMRKIPYGIPYDEDVDRCLIHTNRNGCLGVSNMRPTDLLGQTYFFIMVYMV